MLNTRTCSRYVDGEIMLSRLLKCVTKRNFEQEILNSVLNVLNVGDINQNFNFLNFP